MRFCQFLVKLTIFTWGADFFLWFLGDLFLFGFFPEMDFDEKKFVGKCP